MEIKTGYFAYCKMYTKMGYTPVSIAQFIPKWFKGATYRKLSPSPDLLSRWKNGLCNKEEYTEEFNEYLSKLNREEVLHDLASLTDSDQIILVCFEKSSDFCHRHLVAEWLSNENFSIEELSII